MALSILFNKVTFFCTALVVLISILLRNYEFKPELANKSKHNLFTQEELQQYNGIDKDNMYLAILGNVFDVSKGKKYYEKGAGYNFFIGKDGSRSFITGNFTDESKDSDHVIDLSCDDLSFLTNWVDTYKKKYSYKGKLIGRYYDVNGKSSQYRKQLKLKLKQCELEIKAADEVKQRYPPCNVEWAVNEDTRVWCTKNSGGIKRDWIGVPRQLFTPGEDTPQCVCLDLNREDTGPLLKEFDNCMPTSTSCIMYN